jgi:hypothetical protein
MAAAHRHILGAALGAALAVGGAARASPSAEPRGGEVYLTDGSASLSVAPRLVIDLRAGEGDAGHPRTLAPSAWRADPAAAEGGFALVADVVDEPLALRATLRLERAPDEPAALLTVEIEHLGPRWAHLEAIDLALPPAARPRILDRALRPHPLAGTALLDRFGAKEIRAGDAALLIDDGVDGAVARAGAHGVEVRVDLFSTEDRPFRHDQRCARKWRSPNRKIPLAARLLRAGDKERAQILIALGDAARAPALAKARYPDGRAAALVITDHADQSSPETLAALTRALLGHHLAITKSLFFHGGDRPQLEDHRVAALADELAAAGVEIVPHSATPKPDPRAVTEAALDAFARFHATTWIDHQPETNCEAFSNQGWQPGGRYGLSDLLTAHGYHYLWSARDAGAGQLDLLGDPGHRALTLWPIGRLTDGDPAGDRWVFLSSWMFIQNRRFYTAVAPARIDHLERARGLAILHTYLETLHPRRTRFGLRNLLVRRRGGAVALDPRFDAFLADLERRAARGTLWVPTLAALGDHLRALERVTIRYAADGTATLLSPTDLHGATFVVPTAAAVLVDGQPPAGARTGSDGTTFWLDLAANKPVRVELTAGGARVPLL